MEFADSELLQGRKLSWGGSIHRVKEDSQNPLKSRQT